MARKKVRQPTDAPKREESFYRLYKDTMQDVVTIAARRNKSIAELLDPLIKAFLVAELAIESDQIRARVAELKAEAQANELENPPGRQQRG